MIIRSPRLLHAVELLCNTSPLNFSQDWWIGFGRVVTGFTRRIYTYPTPNIMPLCFRSDCRRCYSPFVLRFVLVLIVYFVVALAYTSSLSVTGM